MATYGIPVLIKDNIERRPKMTTAPSPCCFHSAQDSLSKEIARRWSRDYWPKKKKISREWATFAEISRSAVEWPRVKLKPLVWPQPLGSSSGRSGGGARLFALAVVRDRGSMLSSSTNSCRRKPPFGL